VLIKNEQRYPNVARADFGLGQAAALPLDFADFLGLAVNETQLSMVNAAFVRVNDLLNFSAPALLLKR
jgi:hypothetical protein